MLFWNPGIEEGGNMKLAQLLQDARLKKGVSLTKVWHATEIEVSWLEKLECGAETKPSPYQLWKLASYYQKDYDILYIKLIEAAGHVVDIRFLSLFKGV